MLLLFGLGAYKGTFHYQPTLIRALHIRVSFLLRITTTRDCIAYVTIRSPAHGAFRFSYFSREAFRTLEQSQR